MSTVRSRSIEEITQTLIDYRGKTPTKTSSGVKLITAKVIKDGFIQDSEHEYIAEDSYPMWMRRGLPKQWDILITTEAPLGEVAQLRTPERVALAQRVILLRGNPDLIDQQFYFQALKSPLVQARLRARATGTTVLGIKQSELRQVEIPCPPMEVQQRIAHVLSTYDDLIENNTRRIQILEEMAQAIYREWFVNFRFPGHEQAQMIGSQLGPIPVGWRSSKLGQVAAINRASIRKGDEPEDILYIDIASVSPGRIDSATPCRFEDAPGRARRIVKHGDIIWSAVRPNRQSYALIISPAPNTIASTGFAVIAATRVPYTYLYCAVGNQDFAEYLSGQATGAAYPAVTAADFEKADILLPPTELLDRFHVIAEPLFTMKENLSRRNDVLRRTRDMLLPKLISGDISVSDIEPVAAA